MQDCSNSSALAMELLQSCTKPSIYLFKSYWYVLNCVIISSGNVLKLFGVKPLPKPMATYCQVDAWEQILVMF